MATDREPKITRRAAVALLRAVAQHFGALPLAPIATVIVDHFDIDTGARLLEQLQSLGVVEGGRFNPNFGDAKCCNCKRPVLRIVGAAAGAGVSVDHATAAE